MRIDFAKYQGTGNDFILIDDRDRRFPAADQALVARLCHRRFGIGADGLILLQPDPAYDFRMVYFNADGAEGSMCGNGGRCIVRFAHDLGLFATHTRFRAVDGEHRAEVRGREVHLHMQDVTLPEGGPDTVPNRSFLNTGSPHVVQLVEDIETADVVGEGRRVRYSDPYAPGGTNVNFVQPLADGTLFVRTYERGVEDETYSCGTGVTAAALAFYGERNGQPSGDVPIRTLGGNLRVTFRVAGPGQFREVYLIGPAERVFAGSVTV